MFEINTLRNASKTRRFVLMEKYKTKELYKFYIVERGKMRYIQSMHISDRAVQKLFCEYALKPVMYPQIIYDNPASREGKGTKFALKRLKEHIRWHYARHGKSGYVLLIDFHDYFAKISHEKTIKMITKYQKDDRIVKYLKDFVDLFDGDYGLGLGSETCQVEAISYPTPIDKMVKEKFRIHCYGRYMDDIYIIHEDRNYLEFCYHEIQKVSSELEIEINEKKTKIINLHSDDFVFLKKRFHLCENGKIVMKITRKNYSEQKKKILFNKENYLSGEMPFTSILQSYQSWRAYAQKCNANKAVNKMDKFFYREFADIIYKETGRRKIKFGNPPIKEIEKRME